jgi:hypothetical protein
MDIDTFTEMMKGVSDEKFNETFSKGMLQLTDEQTNTILSMFFLCYMAEKDLEEVLTTAWREASIHFSPEVNTQAKETLKEMVFGKRDLQLNQAMEGLSEEVIAKIKQAVRQGYIEKRDFDIDSLEYFSDKIKIYEAMFGENERTKLLWKINGIRNDISHNRINQLTYNKEDLMLRGTKEKLLVDYLRTSFTSNFEDTEFFKKLTPEQIAEIDRFSKKTT